MFRIFLFSVSEQSTSTSTVLYIEQTVNGSDINVDEKSVECQFSFSATHQYDINTTTVIGHVGQSSVMKFVDPSKF